MTAESFEAQDELVSVREVAALSGTTVKAVNTCIDRHVLIDATVGPRDRRLPARATAFMALKRDLDNVGVTPDMSARLYRELAKVPDRDLVNAHIVLSEVVRIYTEAAAEVWEETCRYLAARQRWITSDRQIKGGIPVIRGTRLDVYSVQQRLDAGEQIDDLVEDYPEIPREAFATAALYARTHPRRGRPPKIVRPTAA